MLEYVAVATIKFCRLLSLSRVADLFPAGRPRHTFMECYVLGFAILLTILIQFVAVAALPTVIIAGYCIFDIVSYRIFFLFVKSISKPWNPSSVRRSLLMVGVNIYELVVGFGIVYLYTGQIKQGGAVLSDPMSAIYFSAVTMMTVGYGDFVPVGHFARIVVCLQLISGLVMLGFIVPALLALFAPGVDEGGPNQRNAPC